MRLNGWGAISLGFLGLVFVVTLGPGSEAGVIRADSQQQAHVIRKRNAWWSKKSTDDIGRIAQAHKATLHTQSLNNMEEAIDCYTKSCVENFIACGKLEEVDFYQCRMEHRGCASQCFGRGKLDLLSDDPMNL